MSFSAIAPIIDSGKMCAMNLAKSKFERSTPTVASTGGRGRPSPTPGWKIVTSSRPRLSDTTLAQTNQPTAFAPTRPSAEESPIWAMPTTSVEKTKGAMIILMRWRKIVVRMEM
jgi:hypothetical protein